MKKVQEKEFYIDGEVFKLDVEYLIERYLQSLNYNIDGIVLYSYDGQYLVTVDLIGNGYITVKSIDDNGKVSIVYKMSGTNNSFFSFFRWYHKMKTQKEEDAIKDE